MPEKLLRRRDLEKMGCLPGACCRVYTLGDLRIICSPEDRYDQSGDVWQHVSFSHPSRMPTYNDTLQVRHALFPQDAEVLQVFPPKKEHVNNHPFCLHLWWNRSRRLTPPMMQYAVGVPGMNEQDMRELGIGEWHESDSAV